MDYIKREEITTAKMEEKGKKAKRKFTVQKVEKYEEVKENERSKMIFNILGLCANCTALIVFASKVPSETNTINLLCEMIISGYSLVNIKNILQSLGSKTKLETTAQNIETKLDEEEMKIHININLNEKRGRCK